MKCKKCGTENSPDATHCMECGTKLIKKCRYCFHENNLDAKVCTKCGLKFKELTIFSKVLGVIGACIFGFFGFVLGTIIPLIGNIIFGIVGAYLGWLIGITLGYGYEESFNSLRNRFGKKKDV
jgi:ribosomal protein L40E